MNKLVYAGAIALLSMSFAGCEQKSNTSTESATSEISASEIVSNPNTASTESGTTDAAVAQITFEQNEYDFGRVVEGEKVRHTFKFTNTGDAPLLIQSANASCGCTTPTWTKTPVAPGEKGEIVAEFDSKGRVGSQNKTITILANTQPNATVVTIKGEVLDGSNGPIAQ